MNHFFVLIKMNMKLLLRNKGFLFFLCITPVISVCILNLKTTSTEQKKQEGNVIVEFDEPSEKAVYLTDTTKYTIKVFDAADTELSEHVLNNLVDEGMFSVCRCKTENMTEQEALSQAQKDAYEDRAGAILHLKRDFDQGVMEGDWNKAIQIYHVSEDERFSLFEDSLKEKLSMIYQMAVKAGSDAKRIASALNQLKDAMPDKSVVAVSGKSETALNSKFSRCRDRVGYSFAIVTLGFLFCGVCIAYTVIEEQENRVYTRIMLSKAGKYEYLSAKLVVSIIIAILQTGIIALCMLLFSDMDFGMKISSYLFMIFLMGIIFNILSLSIGVLMGDVMGANYAVFTIWSVSALLSGLYFSLDSSNTAIKTLSHLMPQRWFLKGAEMLMTGDKSAYSMLIYITIAYLIVILSVGATGLRMKGTE